MGEIESGEAKSGAITEVGQVDVWLFTASEGDLVRIHGSLKE